MDIVTGHVGSAHVTSWQDRDLNQGIFGPDTYILNVGSKLAATIITNNEIDIADGVLVMQGCQGVVQKGTYQALTIDNGTAGMKRIDLICAEYTKVGGVEDLDLVVVKGTPAASNPSDPSYTSGDIQNGDSPVQVPIYRVSLNGLTVESVDALVDVQDSIDDIGTSIGNIGEVYEANASSVSVSKNTSTTIVSLTVSAGTYAVVANGLFSSSGSGNRKLTLTGGTVGDLVHVAQVYKNTNETAATGQLTAICKSPSSFTITLKAEQDIITTMSVSGSIAAVRLK